MKIGIIGGGSIGLLLSSYLSRNNKVTLYVNRKEQKRKINNHGITLLIQGEKDRVTHVPVKLMMDIEEEDCYIICVKQHHIEYLLPYLEHMKQPVIFLQNGMGHLKYVRQLQTDTYVGVVEHGASRLDDDRVHHLGAGVIKIASINRDESALNVLTKVLHMSDFPIMQALDYDPMLKDKLIMNAVINPLTAIFDVANGSILTNEYIKKLARHLCTEAAEALNLDEKEAWERIIETATITCHNTSSMRTDILKRRKTEIEAISGYILQQTGDFPYTNFAYHSVLALEKEGINSDEHTNRI